MAERFESIRFGENFMVPMRDGVELATDIYRPTRDGALVEEPLPVLLIRTPYNKAIERFSGQALNFAAHGYVVATQDVRGRYKSGGVFSKYETEGEDGFDTIEWLARLPYAQPKVGMWGTSYSGHTQADPAKLNPPSLKTLVVNMGGTSNGWDHKIRNHGAFELHQQMVWAFREVALGDADPLVAEQMEREPAANWFSALPLRKGLNPLAISPNFEDYFLAMQSGGDYDDWKGIGTNWVEYYEQTADIPMMHISGWYDSYAGGQVQNYLGLARAKRGPIKLIMGTWIHAGNLQTSSGDVEFGPDAALTGFEREFHVRWYDHFLKGINNGVESEPTIKIFVMGTGDGHKDEHGRLFHGGYWRSEEQWPLPGTRFEPYYFHGDGSLSTSLPGGGGSETTYAYDPANPVPTIGGAYTGAADSPSPAGAYDQRERPDFYGCKPPYLPLKSRSDVVVFQTEPLAEEVEVAGPITFKLYASSSAVDTDFTAKLIDVYPPSADFPSGFEMNLTDGIIRARYRNSPNRQELMKPGAVYEFSIEPFPTANRFKKGHRIRVDISSSNFPRFDVNPNTGELLGQHRRTIVADNTIHHSPERPSHVVLPIVPAKG